MAYSKQNKNKQKQGVASLANDVPFFTLCTGFQTLAEYAGNN